MSRAIRCALTSMFLVLLVNIGLAFPGTAPDTRAAATAAARHGLAMPGGAAPIAGRTISGHVFLDQNGNGIQDGTEPSIANAWVNADLSTGGAGQGAATDGAGDYAITDLTPGIYYVRVDPMGSSQPFVPERWNGRSVLGTGDAVDVRTADGTGIDFSVELGVEISGSVTDHDTGNALSGGWVNVADFASGACCTGTSVMPDGTYSLRMRAGRYRLDVSGYPGYPRMYWNNAFFSSQATAVDTSSGTAASNINFSLVKGSAFGTLHGQVIDGASHAIPGVVATAESYDTGEWMGTTTTDASGYFTFTSLPPGSFKVRFDTTDTNAAHATDFVSAYWSRPSPPGSIDPNATKIDYPTTTELGAFTLATGGSISGTISAPGATGPIYVSADPFVTTDIWYSVTTSVAAPGGSYQLHGLPAPATYRVHAWTDSGNLVKVYYVSPTESTFDSGRAAAVSTTVGTATTGIDIAMVPGATITGSVTIAGGGVLPGPVGITATLHNDPLSRYFWLRTTTDGSGYYELRGLPAGDYEVRTDLGRLDFVDQAYPSLVTVSGTVIVPGIDFVLSAGASISGRVLYNDWLHPDAQPVPNVQVTAYDFAAGGTAFSRWTDTDAEGYYTIHGLEVGHQYRVRVAPYRPDAPPILDVHNLINENWNHHFDDQADPVPSSGTLTSAGVTGIDFTMTLGGTITGVVTDTAVHLLPGVNVTVYDAGGTGRWIASDSTDGAGVYLIRGVAPGQYRVQASPSSGQMYLSQYWDHVSSSSQATPVPVAATSASDRIPTVTGIDFSLGQAYVISGTLRDWNNDPVTGVRVEASGTSGNTAYGTSQPTDTAGAFRITGLRPGSYLVRAITSGTDYSPIDSPQTITDADLTGVAVQVAQATKISGRVYEDVNHDGTYTAGEERAGVIVTAYDFSTGMWRGSATSAADGLYSIHGLPAGQFRVYTSTGSHNFLVNYYNNVSSSSAATPVQTSIVGGVAEDATNIDFRMVKGVEIRGTVFYDANDNGTQDTGEPAVAGASVSALAGSYAYSVSAAADGSYVIHSLSPGQYKVYATAWGTPYAYEYYKLPLGTPNSSQASLVNATTDIAGIDFSLVLGGSVAGTVRDGGGPTVPGISVNVSRADGDGLTGYATTDATGNYVVKGLPAGSYKAYASDGTGTFVSQYYANHFFSTEADPFAVAARASVSDPLFTAIDFNLARGGVIAGVVYADRNGNGTQDAGEPGGGGTVYAYEFASPNRIVRSASILADGSYRIAGLPPATSFRVQVTPSAGSECLAGTYYHDGGDDKATTTLSGAFPATVPAGGTTTINFALPTGASIDGVVYNDASGDGHQGAGETGVAGATVSVELFTSPYTTLKSIATAADGSFHIAGLPVGTNVRVRASAPAGVNYVAVYYNGVNDNGTTSSSAAAPLSLSASGTTIVNFGLLSGGSISGRVYNDLNANGIYDAEPAVSGSVSVATLATPSVSLGSAMIQPDGTYQVTGLPEGVALRVQSNVSSSTGLYNVYYDGGNDTGTPNSSAAVGVSVTRNTTTPNITFGLQPGGSFTGIVRDGNNVPIPNLNVSATPISGSSFSGSGRTDATGTYTIVALAPSPAAFRISASTTLGGTKYYNNQRDSGTATPVSTTSGGTTSGIDLVFGTIPAIVSGPTVTSAQRGSSATFDLTADPARLAGPLCAATPAPPCSRIDIDGGGVSITAAALNVTTGVFTVTITIPADAAIGFRSIAVLNYFPADTTSAILADAFDVKAEGGTTPPSSQYAYVVDSAIGQIKAYGTADNSFVRTIDVNVQPYGLTLSPDGQFAYVQGAGDRTLAIVDTRLGKEVARIANAGSGSHVGVAATARYVFTYLIDRIKAIDARTWTVASEMMLASDAAPAAVKVDPQGRWAYVLIGKTKEIAIVDANPSSGTPTVRNTLPLPTTGSVRDVAFTPDGARAFVLTSTGTYVVDTLLAADPATSPTAIIDTDGNTGNGATPLPTGTSPSSIVAGGVAGTPSSFKVYVATTMNTIIVIDAASNPPTVLRTADVGDSMYALATNADGSRLFLTTRNTEEVVAIDTAGLVSGGAASVVRFATTLASGDIAVGPAPASPNPSAPTISAVTLTGGSPARNGGPFQVTVTGSGFGTAPIVSLARTSVRANVLASSPSSITAEFPAMTPAGDYIVIVNSTTTGSFDETAFSASSIAVRPPATFAAVQSVVVGEYGNAAVAVLSGGTRAEIATQPFPGGIAITPDARLGAVTHGWGDVDRPGSPATRLYDMSLFDLDPGSATAHQVVATLPYVPTQLGQAAATPNLDNPNGVFIYAPTYSSGDMVAVIDPARRAEVDVDGNPATSSVPTSGLPDAIAARLAGITRIELDTTPTSRRMYPYSAALTPDGTLLYVANQGTTSGDAARVSIVDTVTRHVVGELTGDGTAGAITYAAWVALSPQPLPEGVFVYVVGRDSANSPALLVYRAGVLSNATAFVAKVALPDNGRAIAVSPDSRTVYVAIRTLGELIAVDVTPHAGGGINGTVNEIVLTPGLTGLAVAPTDHLLYATNEFGSEVLAFDISADSLHPTLVTSLAVPGAYAVAVRPAIDRPRIASVTPSVGPLTGGTVVTIGGINFVAGAAVQFGGAAAPSVTVVNAYTITATTPAAAAAGSVDVRVTNPDGQFDVVSGRFRYQTDVVPPVFTTPPWIASQAVVGSTVSVEIRWTTDEAATSRVDYGTASTLGAHVEDPTPVTDHRITLTGLAPNIDYQFRATSADSMNASTSSPAAPATASFHTIAVPDASAPVITSGPVVSTTDQSAIVEWTTNEAATSGVRFDAAIDGSVTAPPVGPAGTGTVHSVTVTGLSPNTEYEYAVVSADPSGNSYQSAVARFHTDPAPDVTAPVILSGPTVSYLSNDFVIITWETDEPSTSFINYGIGSVHEMAVLDYSLVRTHIVFLTNLVPNQEYIFQAASSDAAGNTVLTAEPASPAALSSVRLTQSRKVGGFTLRAGSMLAMTAATTGFKTTSSADKTPPAVTVPAIVSVLSIDRALLTVTTDEASSIEVRVLSGATVVASVFDPAFVQEHRVVLTGLSASTTYGTTIVVTDPKGNAATFAGPGFSTPAAPDTTAPAISALTATALDRTSIQASWTTDEPADSSARATASGSSEQIGEAGLRTAHVLRFTGLQADTTYTIAVASRDASGNLASASTTVHTPAAPPVISGVVPSTLQTGSTVPVTITGSQFEAGAVVQFGAGITVTGTTVNGAGTEITAQVAVAATAAPGPRQVTVTIPRTGLTATASITVVTPSDVTPPTLKLVASPNVLWPADHKLVTVTIAVTVSDDTDSNPVVKLVSVTSNEADNGLGDGDTANDIQGATLGTDDRQVQLRAERSAKGKGRIYTLTYRATDKSGNSVDQKVEVTVPLNQGK